MWYMIVRIATGGPKSNENEDVTQEKKKMRVLRAMDVPVRVIMFSARVWSVVDCDAIEVTGAETLSFQSDQYLLVLKIHMILGTCIKNCAAAAFSDTRGP